MIKDLLEMKKFETKIFILIILAYLASCVDDYQDANPPRLLDGPALNSIEVSEDLIQDGTSTTIVANVVDAPAGIDSVAVTTADENGDPKGTTTVETPITGQTRAEIEITYTAPANTAGDVEVSVQVFDKQFDDKGEVVRKGSVTRSVDISIFCEPPLVGTYSVLGEFLVDDFGSPDVTNDQEVTSVDCLETFLVEDLSGGLYTSTYADNYGTAPVEAEINIDSDTNLVTWENVSDQFGGEFIQDPAQPDSFYDPNAKTITIYWTATAYGERGISTFTKK